MHIEHGHRLRTILSVGCAALALALAGSAGAAPMPGQSAPVQVDIARGDLAQALTQLGRTANVQIAFLPDRVRGRKVRALRGSFTVEQALDRLLKDTGLRYQKTSGGTYIVGGPTAETMNKAYKIIGDISAASGREANGREAIPDILVVGKRDWTLNLDIKRTQDDAQPYIVFSKEQIARSGATNLDDFFKNFLNANNAGSTSTQTGNSQSFVNLRGLGSAGTLILVDGRRYSQANTGEGAFGQASINGIPLDAIDRIEVLPSSASGIYGSNAVGGVINIVMRRSYKGLEANAYYGNTSRLDAFENRLSLNGSFPLENGKTRISFTTSWQKTGGLYSGDRDFAQRTREHLLQTSPGYYEALKQPIEGALPNIVSADGSPLVLKPAYGGTALGSRITFLPAGYRGTALDGVAALIANAGKQNLGISPTIDLGPAGNGGLTRLLSPSQNYAASLTVKRKFTDWLELYVEGDYSRYESKYDQNAGIGPYTVKSTAPDSPFTRDVIISLPIHYGTKTVTNVSTNWRLLTGAIVKLPLDWQAAIDLVWNWNIYQRPDSLPGLDQATYASTISGTIGLLRDPAAVPFDFSYLSHPSFTTLHPTRGYSRSYTLKLAGPLPLVRLWGGKPIMTLVAEQDKQGQGDYVGYRSSAASSDITYTPGRSQRVDSVYGEVRFPIVGERNKVPLMRELELQVAGRYDRYVGVGSNSQISCLRLTNGPLSDSAYSLPCPQNGDKAVFATARNSSVNPTVALRWALAKDLTLRGSYSTGYLPPYLNQVVSTDAGQAGTLLAGKTIVNVTDPQRGGEQIGQVLLGSLRVLPAQVGGNPNINPQTSTTWSFGAILTPTFLPGFRFSADWSQIVQKNVYFSPTFIAGGGNLPGGQAAFEDFLAVHPERFTRDTNPATFGPYKVGPIVYADLTLANLSYSRSEAIDFATSYDHQFAGGQLNVTGAATWLRDVRTQTSASSKPFVTTGVADNNFLMALGYAGGVEWKGNVSATYTAKRWSFGGRVRYFGPYWLSIDHKVQPLQNAAKIGAQAYVDIYGSFNLTPKTQLRAGINDLFDRAPPLNVVSSYFYSMYGDPRRANFYLSINRKF
jgi:iron complex outermembrane recepter protein